MKPASVPSRERQLPDVPANSLQEPLPGLDHSPGEHDHVRIDHVHHVHGADRQIIGRLFHQAVGERVFSLGGVEHVLRGQFLGALLFHEGAQLRRPGVAREGIQRSLHHCRGAAIRLQTTPSAAAALPRLSHLDLHMTQFGAVAVLAFHHQVADDNAAADAGAECEQDQAVDAAARSGPVFADGRRVGVVLEGGRQLEHLVDVIADGDVLPRLQVGRIEDQAGGDVHGAGRGDANGGDLIEFQPRGGDGLTHRLAHLLQTVLLAEMRLGGDVDRTEDRGGVIDDTALDAGAPNIDAHEKRWLWHDRGLLRAAQW
jgi:hypothetical protein